MHGDRSKEIFSRFMTGYTLLAIIQIITDRYQEAQETVEKVILVLPMVLQILMNMHLYL